MHWSLNKPVTVTSNGAKVQQRCNIIITPTGYTIARWRLWNRARYITWI